MTRPTINDERVDAINTARHVLAPYPNLGDAFVAVTRKCPTTSLVTVAQLLVDTMTNMTAHDDVDEWDYAALHRRDAAAYAERSWAIAALEHECAADALEYVVELRAFDAQRDANDADMATWPTCRWCHEPVNPYAVVTWWSGAVSCVPCADDPKRGTVSPTLSEARAIIAGLLDDGVISQREATAAIKHMARTGSLWVRVDDRKYMVDVNGNLTETKARLRRA